MDRVVCVKLTVMATVRVLATPFLMDPLHRMSMSNALVQIPAPEIPLFIVARVTVPFFVLLAPAALI